MKSSISFVTRPFYESRVNWVTDPAPPASHRPTTKVSPAPTPAILMPPSGVSSQPPRRQKSRRRRREAARSANHNSASGQADLATPAERTANENSARRRATQPRSAANDLPEMKSTPVEHPHSFTSSLLTQPPISAANQNTGISSRRDHSEIWGLYKPAQTDPSCLSDPTECTATPALSCPNSWLACWLVCQLADRGGESLKVDPRRIWATDCSCCCPLVGLSIRGLLQEFLVLFFFCT